MNFQASNYKNLRTIKKAEVKVILFSQNLVKLEGGKEAINKISYQFSFNKDLSKFYEKFKKNELLA